MAMWDHGGRVPMDHRKLAAIAKVSAPRWPAMWSRIEGLFQVEGGTVARADLVTFYAAKVARSQTLARNGRLGGRAHQRIEIATSGLGDRCGPAAAFARCTPARRLRWCRR
jgi:uncharacterized protein YdaU (DUF1376 family)